MGDLLDGVLVDLDVVGGLDDRRELDAELVLGGRHFVVVLLDRHAHRGHGREHLAADVLRAVHRRHREVALLEPDVVAVIAAVVFGVVVGGELGGVHAEADVVGRVRIAHVVEDEEFGLGAEIDAVAQTGRLHVRLGLLCRGARIAVIGLIGQRLENVAVDGQRGRPEERIDIGRVRIWHEHHVGLVDRLPAGDRGAVEHHAFFEGIGLDGRLVHGDVLQLAARIGEAQVDVLEVLVLDLLEEVVPGGHSVPLLSPGFVFAVEGAASGKG
jgi:hypothetical protein